MRYMMLGCAALVLSACAKNQDQGSDRDTTPVAASQAPVSLDAFAGRWRVRAFNDAGDSIVGYELHATSDTAGWTLVFAGRRYASRARRTWRATASSGAPSPATPPPAPIRYFAFARWGDGWHSKVM